MVKLFENKLVLGLMSGTSLDGLDIAACTFNSKNDSLSYDYKIIKAETIPYSNDWKKRLSNAFNYSPTELSLLNIEYGEYLAQCINNFISCNNLSVHLIGSHGHTIFHKPANSYTLQIGDGGIIKKHTNLTTVSNFRIQDIHLGGQGAPLVPIGDELLFSDFDFCVNLGGFSNMSWRDNGIRKACDISPCNILLNTIALQLNLNYDEGGKLASTGRVIIDLLNNWNGINFYKQSEPKSLGREWFENNFLNNLNKSKYTLEDLLRTSIEHISIQIASWIKLKSNSSNPRILFTGGGVHNDFLMSQIRHHLEDYYIIDQVSNELIDFKEALIFAYLAFLRVNGENNILASVTGACQNHSSGEVYY